MLSYLRDRKIFPLYFQLFFLIALVYIIYSLFDENNILNINPGMILVWNLWWPLIPLTFILFGRIWCSVCPYYFIGELINKIILFKIEYSDKFLKYSTLSTLLVFILISISDTVIGLESNQGNTLVVFLILIVVSVVSAIIFNEKTYCDFFCPMGTIIKIYDRFSFLKFDTNKKICHGCIRQMGKDADTEIKDNMNWRFKVDCISKCKRDSIKIKYNFLIESDKIFRNLTFIEAICPAIIVSLFASYIFLKSNFIINIYNNTLILQVVNFRIFLILMIVAVIVVGVLLSVSIISFLQKVLYIDREIVLKSFLSITPMLLFFHLALMIQNIKGVSALQHFSPIFNFLSFIQIGNSSLRLASYILIFIGSVLSFIVFFKILESDDSSEDFSISLMGFISIFFILNLIQIITVIKYSSLFG